MDVQALGSASSTSLTLDPAQAQNLTSNPSPSTTTVSSPSLGADAASSQPSNGSAPGSNASKGTTPKSSVHENATPTVIASTITASYKYVSNPVQIVVVFTNSANGQEVEQIPSQALVKLAEFDRNSGALVDRNA